MAGAALRSAKSYLTTDTIIAAIYGIERLLSLYYIAAALRYAGDICREYSSATAFNIDIR